jgi:hypothetical protein
MRRPAENGVAPVDYGKLNAVYLGVLAGVVLAARRRGAAPLSERELLTTGAATFALSKVIAKEKVGSWVREPFVDERGDDRREPRGHGVRAAVGELLTCSRCVGAWSAAAVVGLRLAWPDAGRAVNGVLATSAASDFLQAAFNWATGRADAAQEAARQPLAQPSTQPEEAR